MSKISELWPDFAAPEIPQTEIKKLAVDRDRKTIFLSLFCDVFDGGFIANFDKYIKDKYAAYGVEIEYSFDKIAFGEAACRYIIDGLHRSGMPINGFFNECKFNISNGAVDFELKYGGKTFLAGIGFERAFSKRARDMFGITPGVTFSGTTELSGSALNTGDKLKDSGGADKPKKRKPKQSDTRALSQNDIANGFIELEDGGFVTVTGKKPQLKDIAPLGEAVLEEGKCTVCGEVFFTDINDTRKGSKIVTVGITDYTGSVYIKTVDKPALYTSVEKGDTLVVSGDITFSKFDNDNILSPRDIIKVNPKRAKDTAERKRVELHLHTNMSAMDAIAPVTKVIDRALEYGHSAVAITDHGVLQAFPDAQNHVRKIRATKPDFKIIYGVECYYVDDSTKVVSGDVDADIDAEFVCFDLETTGLSASADRIIEIGAVVIKNGEILDSFNTFVDPERPLPREITKLTGITEQMLSGAPTEREAVDRFLTFAGGCPLIAHNASFDMSFLNAALKRLGTVRDFTYIDTLALSQALLPELSRHRLDTLTRHFKLQHFSHHRAKDDAAATARVYFKLVEMLPGRGIKTIGDMNSRLGGKNVRHARPNHMILLAANADGLKNLYKLVTKSHLNYFSNKRPRIPLSELMRHREGLIVGSACESGELFTAMLEGKPTDDIERIAQKYDYIEIQPRSNNMFLVDKGVLKDESAILEINTKLVELGHRLGKPVVATCDVHYLDRRDAVYRDIISNGPGFEENNSEQSLDFKTTDDMLKEFNYLGEQTARKVVVDNTNAVADMIDGDIEPIPAGAFTPQIDGSDDLLRQLVEKNRAAKYGPEPDSYIDERINKELESIIGHNYSVLYVVAEKLVSKSESDGYHVGSRGSVGSSFIANLIGISEVNPLPPHYLCKECKHLEYIADAGSGFDVPDKDCPSCGAVMRGDGHDIPFETFLGFEGEKQPDIDLNFSGEYQLRAHKYTEELFGEEHVFKAGTISALKEKTAYGYVKKYLEEKGEIVNKAEENRLVMGCTGVKRTTGQHPGGMVVIPRDHDITDFTPVQHPADKSEQGVVTTHFDFSSLHDTLLKLDELGHDVPTMYRYIEQLTEINVNDVPMNDGEVLKLFTSPEPLGVTESDIDSKTGTFGLPEMGTPIVRSLLIESQPKTFSDLVQVSGLSHGKDVWTGNAQALIKNKVCTIKDVIGTRDSIMIELIKKGVAPPMAFEIMELTRRGRAAEGFSDAHLSELRRCKVPEWYIDSCKKINYMFPKAHAAAYVTSAIRLAWFKLYYPLEFYATYFTVRGSDIDIETALGGAKKAKKHLNELKVIMKDDAKRTPKDEDTYVAVQMLCEMLCRGYEFLPVSFYSSHATKFVIENGKLRLPFIAVKGVGDNAAQALYSAAQTGGYVSAEEITTQPGITPSLIEALDGAGAFGDLPMTSQLSLF